MKEARIILPVVDNMLKSLNIHDAFMRSVTDMFGGFTMTTGSGGWKRDNGEYVDDDVAIYDIACDEHSDSTYDKLFLLATEYGRQLGQQAVYLRYPDGEVEIVDLDPPVAAPHHPAKDCATEPQPDLIADDDGMGQAIGATLDRDNVMDAVPRYPEVGDIWRARNGATVAVVERYNSGPLSGLLKCRVLRGRGSTLYVTTTGEASGVRGRAFGLVEYVGRF